MVSLTPLTAPRILVTSKVKCDYTVLRPGRISSQGVCVVIVVVVIDNMVVVVVVGDNVVFVVVVVVVSEL